MFYTKCFIDVTNENAIRREESKKKKKKEKIHTSDGGYIGKRWVAHIKCNLSFHTN